MVLQEGEHHLGLRWGGLYFACATACVAVDERSIGADLEGARSVLYGVDPTLALTAAPLDGAILRDLRGAAGEALTLYYFRESLEELSVSAGGVRLAAPTGLRRELPDPLVVARCELADGPCDPVSGAPPIVVAEPCFDPTKTISGALRNFTQIIWAHEVSEGRVLAAMFLVGSHLGLVQPDGRSSEIATGLGEDFVLRAAFSAGPTLWLFGAGEYAVLRIDREAASLSILRDRSPLDCIPDADELVASGDPAGALEQTEIYLQDLKRGLYRFDGARCETLRERRLDNPPEKVWFRRGGLAWSPEGGYFADAERVLRVTVGSTVATVLDARSEAISATTVLRAPSGELFAAGTTEIEVFPDPFALYMKRSADTRFARLDAGDAPRARYVSSMAIYRRGVLVGGNPAVINYFSEGRFCPETPTDTGNVSVILPLADGGLFVGGLPPTDDAAVPVAFLRPEW